MGTVNEIIARNHSEIVKAWMDIASREEPARQLTTPEIASLIPDYLDSLGRSALSEIAHLSQAQEGLIEHHLSNRLREGFDLNQILTEFAMLGRCVFQVLSAEDGERPSVPDVARLFAELYLTSLAATRIFNEHMLEDEQTMKRYQRLLQNIASDALVHEHSAPLRARLDEVLTLILSAAGADTAVLLLFDAATHEPLLSASTGLAHEQLREHVASLDFETAALEPTEALRASGIRTLVGVKIDERHSLRGVLYVGLAEPRAFTASEIRRLESLSGTLAVHLDNARLNAALREKVEELKGEAELRERFVSILMHDLKGLLSTARLGAEALPANDATREPAARIVHSLDRLDCMVDDLLDTHRLRMGERLSLVVADCDLVDIAREVVGELRALYGDRFVLRAERRVRGVWSADQLHRALWNLATNAVEHGAELAPIFIFVRGGPEAAELAVHNAGPSISTEDQARLFRPFSRARSALASGQRGWGLGLTLVWGCAEAHGGRVSVDSTPGKGTTFTLRIPYDARPYAD